MRWRQALGLIWLTATALQAQESETFLKATGVVQATAEVTDFVEMITLADINVGTVQPSQGIVNMDPRLDAGAGIIMLSGRPSASVRITYTPQVEMINAISGYTLTVNYNLAGHPHQNQNEATTFTTNPVQVQLGEEGEYYIWIGCLFNLSAVQPGQYDGDFVIEVEYP